MNFCGSCGNFIEIHDNFCGKCGTKIERKKDYYDEVKHSINGILVALVSKIAKVDGRICEAEADYISNLVTHLPHQNIKIVNIRDIYKRIMNNEKDNVSNINLLCHELISLNITESEKRNLVGILLELAYINSKYDEAEENLIVAIVHNLELDFKTYQNIKSKFAKTDSNNYNQSKNENTSNKKSNSFNGSISLSEAFVIFELDQNASDKEIKDKYRQLAKKYHYDSMVSKDLPKDILDFAEEKLKMINASYEVIKKYKGM